VSRADLLDLGDPAAVRAWLASLRVAIADAHGVTEDMLRPLRERDLGHAEHRRLFLEAKGKIEGLLGFAHGEGDGGGDRAD
jgi:hypothetical protein